ncbi:unnamed protein product [Paramecium sonneborni]|uniref:Uncharacterized protein n=1 Tax=Paramecium sonneborni TaxID=65129 RepID=A0A8S1MW93_9CILI|nr:unnamed protein product [Paramecium sonneborni]CAD8081175.1 unnamed protein product [Paramecium sonneborni]
MQLFLDFEDQQNELIIGTLAVLSIFLILFLYFKRQVVEQKTLYEKSYIKQTAQEFEQNKQQLTQYHIQKLQEDPKFKEWKSQSKNI